MGGSFSTFQSLCTRLQENDPDVVVVNTDTFPYFDTETAQQLGKALKQNTFVQRLSIDISNLAVTAAPDDGVTQIARFVQKSASIRTVLLKSPGLASTGVYMCPNQRQDVSNVMMVFFAALAESKYLDEVILVNLDLILPCRHFHRFLTNCKPNVRRLRISYGQELEPNQMTTIMDGFAQNEALRGLELTEVPESVWSACLAGIAMNENLHSLNLDRMGEDYEHAPLNNVIETNTSIKSLSITQSRFVSVSAIATSLARNDTIVELILSNCGIGAQEAIHLKRLVKDCPHIARLNLSSNNLRQEGLHLLTEGLYRNRTLSLLDISDNELEGTEAARTFGNLLRRNRTLARIDADRNNWASPTGIRACAEGLARNHQLATLDFSLARLDSQTMAILADVGLRHNTCLQVLALNANHVSSAGLRVLLQALEVAGTVHSLSLNDNNLNEDGGMILAESLRNQNCPLKRLAVNNNNLGAAGVLALAGSLAVNTRLQCLGFEENPFGKEAMDGLCNALKTNLTLNQISFTFNDLDWTPQWYKTLEMNKGLTSVKTPGVVAESPTVEARLDFYTWRNVCRPLVMQSPCLSDGVWTKALHQLVKKSKHSAIFHVLRGQLPTSCHHMRRCGRKRSAGCLC